MELLFILGLITFFYLLGRHHGARAARETVKQFFK